MADGSEDRTGKAPPRGGPGPPADLRIADALRCRILDGSLAPGTRLPGEAALGALHGVSRPTMREVLRRLSAEGLIVTRRGARGGSEVPRLGTEEAGTRIGSVLGLLGRGATDGAAALVEARLALETAAAPLAAARRTEADLAALRAAAAAARGGPDAATGPDETPHAFARAYAAATGNPALTAALLGLAEAIGHLGARIAPTGAEAAEIALIEARIAERLARRDATGTVEEFARLAAITAARLAAPPCRGAGVPR